MTSLLAISPIDGRYSKNTKELIDIFSEFAIVKYRVRIELDYYQFLTTLLSIDTENVNTSVNKSVNSILKNFNKNEAEKVKHIETRTNHDVKAVEYYLQDKFSSLNLPRPELIHFGLTSQDVNSVTYSIQLRQFTKEVYSPLITSVCITIKSQLTTIDTPFLCRTHGQPATPTKLGDQFNVFLDRLCYQIMNLNNIDFRTKFGGATGNMNAHRLAYPDIDWESELYNFCMNKYNLNRHKYTTQIDHYDNHSELFDCLKRINVILIDFCQDIWLYISNNVFSLKINKGEIGSSTMPHKVNPIDFENAEGNLHLANAFLELFTRKLPVSRLQRDLTDSTILRNLGTCFGHILIAVKAILRGIDKLQVNEIRLLEELDSHWEVVTEGIQTILRREGIVDAYELMKDLTRKGLPLNAEIISEFIDTLTVSEQVKKEIRQITPRTYI